MVKDRFIHKESNAGLPIEAQASRCARMRFNKNTCSACSSICKTSALSLDGGVSLDSEKCTLCMLCVSECPSGCLEIKGLRFSNLLSRLGKIENSHPVLGCKNARDLDAHEKVFCLGFLSEEHLIAAAEFLEKPLCLNLTACAQCGNSFIVQKLKDRVEKAKTKISSGVAAKIRLVEEKSDLVFEDISYDRRGFFQALKAITFARVAASGEEAGVPSTRPYSAKAVPLKRELLNMVMKRAPSGNAAAGILENYAFNVRSRSSCNNCFACVGMCPTGALKGKKDAEAAGLLFNSSLCNGCGLCKQICALKAVTLSKGFKGADYFQYEICNAGADATRQGRKKLTENLHAGEVYSSHGKHIAF